MTWTYLSLAGIAVVAALAYRLLRGYEDAGPSGKARCRQCNQLFDNTQALTTDAMHAWREWGLVLCPRCADKKGKL